MYNQKLPNISNLTTAKIADKKKLQQKSLFMALNGDCGLSGAGQAVQLRCGFNSYKNV